MNISTALVTIEIDSLVYIACYFVLQRRPFSVRICIACNFIVSEMELRSKTLTRRRSTNSLEGAFSPRTDNPLNVQSFPAGRGINNIFQSLVVQSNLIDLRSTSQAPVLKQPSNQPPQHFDSGCSPENQKPLQNCFKTSSLISYSRDSYRSDQLNDRVERSKSHAAQLPHYPLILRPNNSFLFQDPENLLTRALSGYNASGKPIDWTQIHLTIFPYYPWNLRPNKGFRQEDSSTKVNTQSNNSCKTSRTNPTSITMPPPNKRSISEVIDQMEDSPSPAPKMRRLVSEAGNGLIQEPRTPPVVTWQTTLAIPYHQHRPSASSGHQLRSTPGPTPSGSRQGASSVSPCNLVKDAHPIDSSKANQSPVYDSASLVRNVLREARKNPDDPGLREDLECLKSRLPEVDALLGLDLNGLLGSLSSHQRSTLVRKTKMLPVYRLTDGLFGRTPPHKSVELVSRRAPSSPSNPRSDDTTPVNRDPNLLPDESSILDTSKDLAVGSASTREVPKRQQTTTTAARQSLFQNASTPASSARSFSVMVSSPSQLSGPKPLVFGLAESDKEPTPKAAMKTTPRREQPKRAAANKVSKAPTSGQKENGISSSQTKAFPPTESEKKKRGRQTKPPGAIAKAKAPKKKNKLSALPKDFSAPKSLPVAKYNVYFCEWEDCPAELHNLETLRNHVLRVHDKKLPSGARLCLWGKCCQNHNSADNKKRSPAELDRAEFKTKVEWQDHINEAHILPVAWQLGDGPKATIPGRFLPILLRLSSSPKSQLRLKILRWNRCC